MKGLAIAGVLAVAATLSLSTGAQADWRLGVTVVRNDRDGRGYGESRHGSSFRYGYDRGWREGAREGQSDGRRRRDARYWREDDFRDADNGYRSWMGPRFEYSRGYREGYADGYRRAYASARPGWRDRGRPDRYDDRWRHERDDDWRR